MVALGVLLLATLAFIPYGDNAAAKGQQQVAVRASSSPGSSRPTRSRPACRSASRSRPRTSTTASPSTTTTTCCCSRSRRCPTATSHIVYTFKVPGRYQVVCLEFCGVDHHKMIGSFQVRAMSDADAGSRWTTRRSPIRGRARVAKSLTLWYVLASTAIFLVAGLLGAALRQSQADIVRLDDNTFYAVMTAHGLGAFVGWAAFAVMGFAWWVLAEVGFPIGRLGARAGAGGLVADGGRRRRRGGHDAGLRLRAARGCSSTRCRSTRPASGATG